MKNLEYIMMVKKDIISIMIGYGEQKQLLQEQEI
jgi:hypothetical protein